MKTLLLGMLFLTGTAVFAQNNSFMKTEIQKQTQYSLKLCKSLHKNPELSFQEIETAKVMASELTKDGFEVTSAFAGNSVVGILKNGDGPVVMLRTDMDALPIEEETAFDFASTKKVVGTNGKTSAGDACLWARYSYVGVGWNNSCPCCCKKPVERYVNGYCTTSRRNEWWGKCCHRSRVVPKIPGVPDYAMAYHINPELEVGKSRIGCRTCICRC